LILSPTLAVKIPGVSQVPATQLEPRTHAQCKRRPKAGSVRHGRGLRRRPDTWITPCQLSGRFDLLLLVLVAWGTLLASSER